MTEKEKKAIKDLKEISHYCSLRAIDIDNKYSDLWARYVVSIQIVKNLIETLIAENKELKERNKTMLSDEEREALRNFKSEYETCKYNSSDLIIELDDAKIILNLFKNLIAENKELKEKIKEINEEYNAEQKHEMENTIPKSKVEELKDKIHRELEINAVTRRDLIYIDLNLARIDQYFNELLGKE